MYQQTDSDQTEINKLLTIFVAAANCQDYTTTRALYQDSLHWPLFNSALLTISFWMQTNEDIPLY